MARRKRLSPATIGAENVTNPAFGDVFQPDALAPELKSTPPAASGFASPPPIAQVVAETATRAALQELSAAMSQARAEGRLVLRLALDEIDAEHLVRDRIGLDEDELQGLLGSIRAHGQRTPIEVTELANGRYGLISGWRRLSALRRLSGESGAAQFGHVLALVRRPETAADAYVAMVEENEIRLGLSYYERARIAARAVEQGVFASERLALQQLFANASRPRRSKIGSFLTLYRHLEGRLRFPDAIPERLGLALVKLLDDSDPAAIEPLLAAFQQQPAADAASEMARLAAWVAGAAADQTPDQAPALAEPVASVPAATPASALLDVSRAKHLPAEAPLRHELRPGVFLQIAGGFTRPVLTLSGPGVDPVFRERLEQWLAEGR